MKTIRDFAKLKQVMDISKVIFNGDYRIDICMKDSKLWVSIPDGWDGQ